MRFRFLLMILTMIKGIGLMPLLAEEMPTIGISQIVAHPSLDEVYQGFVDALQEGGWKNGENVTLVYKNANGNIITSAQIARDLISLNPKPKVIMAIGTPTAQSILAAARNTPIPVVFGAVTDPVSSRLVKDINNPQGLITGIIDFPPIAEQIAFMAKVIPHLKTIGIIYNPGEPNSVVVVEQFKGSAAKAKYKIILSPISKTTDINQAAQKLIDKKVDAIYIPQDNTVVAAMPALAQICLQAKCPLFTSDSGSVKNGALAALSYSYYDVGHSAGTYVIQLLQGKDIKSLPIRAPSKPKIYINEATRKALDFVMDDAILQSAEKYSDLNSHP
jgi:putative ABC transport system substrate-binding protein